MGEKVPVGSLQPGCSFTASYMLHSARLHPQSCLSVSVTLSVSLSLSPSDRYLAASFECSENPIQLNQVTDRRILIPIQHPCFYSSVVINVNVSDTHSELNEVIKCAGC